MATFDITLSQLEAAAATIYKHITPTPQISWPFSCITEGKASLQGKKVGVILSWGNIDQSLFERALKYYIARSNRK